MNDRDRNRARTTLRSLARRGRHLGGGVTNADVETVLNNTPDDLLDDTIHTYRQIIIEAERTHTRPRRLRAILAALLVLVFVWLVGGLLVWLYLGSP